MAMTEFSVAQGVGHRQHRGVAGARGHQQVLPGRILRRGQGRLSALDRAQWIPGRQRSRAW